MQMFREKYVNLISKAVVFYKQYGFSKTLNFEFLFYLCFQITFNLVGVSPPPPYQYLTFKTVNRFKPFIFAT